MKTVGGAGEVVGLVVPERFSGEFWFTTYFGLANTEPRVSVKEGCRW